MLDPLSEKLRLILTEVRKIAVFGLQKAGEGNPGFRALEKPGSFVAL
jgi:hypothetical protein